jgi:hypothetical protein
VKSEVLFTIECLLGRQNMGRKNSNAAVAQTPAANTAVSYPTSEQLVASGFTTKSARIRELHRLGMPTGDIARQETNGLYQHAYNVIKKPLKGRPVAEAPATPVAETDASE